MPVTNNLKPMVDLPFFELTNQAPLATAALSGMTSAESGDTPFIYYLSTSTFYRYDTVGDTWQQLATPNIAPLTVLKMRYTRRRGFHGRVLSATSTSLIIPGLRGGVLDNATISLESGLGAGQERTLNFVREIVNDAGVITGTTTSTLADSTKKWKINQWAGYTVGITFGTDVTHYKKILYNDATTLTIADVNLQPHDPWNNQAFVAAAPYALPVTTAGLQAHFQIMSSEFSVAAWDVIPDYTTFFTTLTGGIYLVSSAAAAPFFTLQYYDVANDTWQTKTVMQGLLPAALGTDVALERTGKIGNSFVTQSGTVTAPTSRSLVDTGLTLSNDRYANHRIFITSGSGRGQNRRIVAHTSGTFTVARNWDVLPIGSQYQVWPDSDRLYLGGNSSSAMFAYSPQNDYWMQGQAFDDGITTNISATLSGYLPFGVSTGVRIAAGIRTINSTPTAGGTGYTIGDVLTCSVGGTGAQVIVTQIAAGGIVTAIELAHMGTGTGFTAGIGRATSGGTGTGCTIEILTVGATALITTATSHLLKTGDIITFAGCTEAAYNTSHTVFVNSITSFSIATTATANMAAATSQTTTLIVDPTKNWIVNEHVGRLVHLSVAGTAPTAQIRWITANTTASLTVNTIAAGGNGTSKYVIYDSKAFGNDTISRVTGRENFGWATGSGQTTTTLVDNTKSWIPNQWSGSLFRVEAGTGYGSGKIVITANSTSSLSYATQTFTPDSSTKYEIADSWGLVSTAGSVTTITETSTKNWPINWWAGKRVRVTAGTTGVTQESGVVSNTGTVLTTGTITAVSADAAYCILSIPIRGAATEFIWIHGATDPGKKGRYMYYPRGGGSNTFDIFDITTGTFTFGIMTAGQNEGYTTGTSYTYDGVDTLYFSRSAVGQPIRIFKYNIENNTFRGGTTTTFLQGTAHVGNLMEILSTTDGLEYIYCLQNTGTLMARALLF
jgi:hypothetical protein